MLLDPRDDAAAEARGRDPKTGRLILAFSTVSGLLTAALTKQSGVTEHMGFMAEAATLYGGYAVGQMSAFGGTLYAALNSSYVDGGPGQSGGPYRTHP